MALVDIYSGITIHAEAVSSALNNRVKTLSMSMLR